MSIQTPIRHESLEQVRARHSLELDQAIHREKEAAYIKGLDDRPMQAGAANSIKLINAAVAIRNGLEPSDMLERTNAPKISHTRQEAFSECYAKGHTMPAIGKFYGKNPATVSHGINAHDARTSA